MLRTPCLKGFSLLQKSFNNVNTAAAVGTRFLSVEEKLELKYEKFFNRPDLDGWELRKGINDIAGIDFVPQPKMTISILKACRRINDVALAIRFLELVKIKCGTPSLEAKIYPYVIQEIRPTLNELGLETPEELGFDKPEYALPSPFDG